MMFKELPFILLGFVSIFTLSCEKERSFSVDDIETDHVSYINTTESYYCDIYLIARAEVNAVEKDNNLSLGNTEGVGNLDVCTEVLYEISSDSSYVESLTMIYIDGACYSGGKQKQGKLKVFLDGKLGAAGTVMTIQPELFYVDGRKIEGTIKITNVGFNSNLLYEVHKEVQNGKVLIDNANFLTWDSDEQLQIDLFNRSFKYTISANGVLTNGFHYDVTTKSNLKRNMDCRYIQSGELEININSSHKQSINYGWGACDSQAELWQKGVKKDIELR